MKKVKFILKEPAGKGETLIFLICRDQCKFKYSIREKVHPDHWNFAAQRMRELRGLPYLNFNRRLDLIERKFEDISLDLKNRLDYSRESLAREMDFFFQRRQPQTLLTYIDNYVKGKTASGGALKVKSINTLKNKLEAFSRETGTSISYSAINDGFYKKFTAWFSSQKRVLKDETEVYYSLNYIAKMTGNIRRMMNQSRADGMHRSDDYKAIRKKEEDVYKVYLSDAELKKLIDADLPGMYANARDLFIIGCYTGLRVGNYMNIDPDIQVNLQTGFIQAIVNKNGPRVIIPIHTEVEKIIRRLNGMPRAISDNKLNKYIKEACRLAGITEKIMWMRTEGGQRREHVNDKCDLVSSHTARRSFCTNAMLAGIPVYDIMLISGHRTIKTFMRYIGIQQQETAHRLKDHAFFRGA